jgi:alkylation response protein AidB-like acyl-CoA dehydrogenase
MFQREVFGKRLVDQPVIRNKLAEMAAGVEVVHRLIGVAMRVELLHIN